MSDTRSSPDIVEAMELARNIIHGPLHAATLERNYAKAAEYQSYIDTIEAALRARSSAATATQSCECNNPAILLNAYGSEKCAKCGLPALAQPTGSPSPRLGGIGVDWWAESVKLYRQNQKLRKALKEQHDWHLAQGEQDFGDGIKLNMAEEYADSGMYERTVAVLDSAASPVPSTDLGGKK